MTRKRKMSFEDACALYVHRFTMEHVPRWAMEPFLVDRYPAPQYASDREWYENTYFPGEGELSPRARHCCSTRQTWPLGQTLPKPYRKEPK